jgi:hypothetical protein
MKVRVMQLQSPASAKKLNWGEPEQPRDMIGLIWYCDSGQYSKVSSDGSIHQEKALQLGEAKRHYGKLAGGMTAHLS